MQRGGCYISPHVFRWETAIPLSVARFIHQDDVCDGILIPKGTNIIQTHGIMQLTFIAEALTQEDRQWIHDLERYPNPGLFGSTRFIAPGASSVVVLVKQSLDISNLLRRTILPRMRVYPEVTDIC
jgi:hypothetical protein